MNWKNLLSLKRHGDTQVRHRVDQDETRLGFDVDYDRVIFSSEFRSLQDKTQVVPFSQGDFVHTRLTHSLETSVVGRSLGRKVGLEILKKYPYLKDKDGYHHNDFGAIVASASLAHDIGNPPFGHLGEKSIGQYFLTGPGNIFKNQLSKIEFQDLCDFEGNANGFKILTQSRPGREGGLRLSYATLGAFVKYPKGSLPVKPTSGVADKKYGFFHNEKNIYDEIATELDLKNDNGIYLRHPLTFLVEAADDICYTIIDFEDGINLGLIEEDYALEYLINLVRNTINTKKYNSLNNTPDRVSYLRALSINTLINDAVKIFLDNEDEILKGSFQTSLLKRSEYSAQISDILKISIEKIYQSKEVIEKEVAGYNIINKLLDTFICSVNSSFAGTNTSYDDLILKLLPSTINLNQNSLYSRLLEVCHFVASLSDRKALNVYNKITGVEYQ